MDLESTALTGQDSQNLSDAEEVSEQGDESNGDDDGSEEAGVSDSSCDNDGEPLDAHQMPCIHCQALGHTCISRHCVILAGVSSTSIPPIWRS